MKSGWILDFMLKGSFGLVCIYLCNTVLSVYEYSFYAAINIVTFILCAIMGLPGVIISLFIPILRGMGV